MADSGDPKKPDQTFTSADRIRQLNDIDQDVSKLIHSAGLAIQALTNARSDDSPSAAAKSLDSHKTEFNNATSQYFALVSSIDVRLRRQVYALEEASILAPDSTSKTTDGTASGGGSAGTSANVLDISWLNSRKDTVGKDKEAELWAAARGFVEQLGESGTQPSKTGNRQEGMEVD